MGNSYYRDLSVEEAKNILTTTDIFPPSIHPYIATITMSGYYTGKYGTTYDAKATDGSIVLSVRVYDKYPLEKAKTLQP